MNFVGCYLYQAKRQKGIQNQSKNKYPHSLSRGGYKLLKQKMTQASGDGEASIVDPPRHEMWKQARIKRSGEYTSEASALVAEKIVSNCSILILILIVTSLYDL